MLTYLSIGGAFILLCVVGGVGFYVGARHVEELSGIVRNPDRPNWAQEPVDAFNSVVGRPTSKDPAAALYEADDEGDESIASLDSDAEANTSPNTEEEDR